MKKLLAILLAIVALAGVCAISCGAFLGTAAEASAQGVTLIKTGLLGKKLCFSDADFKSALCVSDFDTVTVKRLPASEEGTLLLGGRRVSEGQSIKRRNVASLVFIPASAEVAEASFTFVLDGYCSDAPIECKMRFIDKINHAPAAQSGAMKTQSAVSAHGRLAGEDPEGDAIEFIVVSYPKRGILSLDGASYVYTPTVGYTGSDSFTYVVRDEYGNYSEPCSVRISVIERMCATEYVDMVDKESYNAALAMSAMGIMSGKLVGDDHYFIPEGEVSKAEFVAMAMKAAGIRKDTTLTKTFFDDNADIPTSLVGYVATAQRTGIINGDFENGRLVFNPNARITKYEAAQIMAAILGLSASDEQSEYVDDGVTPVWARGSVNAMMTLGIFTEQSDADTSEPISRGDCATYLYRLASR